MRAEERVALDTARTRVTAVAAAVAVAVAEEDMMTTINMAKTMMMPSLIFGIGKDSRSAWKCATLQR
jgi:hypothetical protein